MKYTIVFSIYAVDTYDSIKEQIASRWGDKIVNDFEERAVKVLTTIQQSPLIFQVINNDPNIRKGFIHGNCSVFYEIRENYIEILYFWDNRQEPML